MPCTVVNCTQCYVSLVSRLCGHAHNGNVVTFDPANFGLLKGHAIVMTLAGGEPGDEASVMCCFQSIYVCMFVCVVA